MVCPASQWYLLLGATSSASALLNLVILQWPVVRCCRVVVRRGVAKRWSRVV